MSGKRHGLILTLGGAPASPHVVSPLPGFYRPDVPHLVGQEGDDLTLKEARAAAEEYDILELVDVSSTQEKDAADIAAEDLAAGRNAVAEIRRDGRAGDSPSRAKDHADAVAQKGDD